MLPDELESEIAHVREMRADAPGQDLLAFTE